MQYIGLMALVEDQIVDCFRRGGVPYSAFPRFQAVMAEDSGAVHDATLTDVTLPLVPGLIGRLRRGIDVADVGCGSGHAVNLMAEAFPRWQFVGFDFSDAGIAAARLEAERKGLANARFDKRDAAHLGEVGRFDLNGGPLPVVHLLAAQRLDSTGFIGTPIVRRLALGSPPPPGEHGPVIRIA
jgi:SAM-dependent methyltransferase